MNTAINSKCLLCLEKHQQKRLILCQICLKSICPDCRQEIVYNEVTGIAIEICDKCYQNCRISDFRKKVVNRLKDGVE